VGEKLLRLKIILSESPCVKHITLAGNSDCEFLYPRCPHLMLTLISSVALDESLTVFGLLLICKIGLNEMIFDFIFLLKGSWHTMLH